MWGGVLLWSSGRDRVGPWTGNLHCENLLSPISLVQLHQNVIIHASESHAAGCELPLEFSQRRFFSKMRQANLLQGVGGLMQATSEALCKQKLGLADWDREKPFLFRNASWDFTLLLIAILCSCRKDRNCSVNCTELCIIYVSFLHCSHGSLQSPVEIWLQFRCLLLSEL